MTSIYDIPSSTKSWPLKQTDNDNGFGDDSDGCSSCRQKQSVSLRRIVFDWAPQQQPMIWQALNANCLIWSILLVWDILVVQPSSSQVSNNRYHSYQSSYYHHYHGKEEEEHDDQLEGKNASGTEPFEYRQNYQEIQALVGQEQWYKVWTFAVIFIWMSEVSFTLLYKYYMYIDEKEEDEAIERAAHSMNPSHQHHHHHHPSSATTKQLENESSAIITEPSTHTTVATINIDDDRDDTMMVHNNHNSVNETPTLPEIKAQSGKKPSIPSSLSASVYSKYYYQSKSSSLTTTTTPSLHSEDTPLLLSSSSSKVVVAASEKVSSSSTSWWNDTYYFIIFCIQNVDLIIEWTISFLLWTDSWNMFWTWHDAEIDINGYYNASDNAYDTTTNGQATGKLIDASFGIIGYIYQIWKLWNFENQNEKDDIQRHHRRGQVQKNGLEHESFLASSSSSSRRTQNLDLSKLGKIPLLAVPYNDLYRSSSTGYNHDQNQQQQQPQSSEQEQIPRQPQQRSQVVEQYHHHGQSYGTTILV